MGAGMLWSQLFSTPEITRTTLFTGPLRPIQILPDGRLVFRDNSGSTKHTNTLIQERVNAEVTKALGEAHLEVQLLRDRIAALETAVGALSARIR